MPHPPTTNAWIVELTIARGAHVYESFWSYDAAAARYRALRQILRSRRGTIRGAVTLRGHGTLYEREARPA